MQSKSLSKHYTSNAAACCVVVDVEH